MAIGESGMRSDVDAIGGRVGRGVDVGFALDPHGGFLWLGRGV
jgi:hypothetical protein